MIYAVGCCKWRDRHVCAPSCGSELQEPRQVPLGASFNFFNEAPDPQNAYPSIVHKQVPSETDAYSGAQPIAQPEKVSSPTRLYA